MFAQSRVDFKVVAVSSLKSLLVIKALMPVVFNLKVKVLNASQPK